jgi:hypothetical protein
MSYVFKTALLKLNKMRNAQLTSFFKLVAIGFIALNCFNASAQKNELGISVNSGLFSFSGASAQRTSFLVGISPDQGYTNNPYGTQGGFCYGGSANLKHLTHKRFILGLDLGYETLKSEIGISSFATQGGSTTTEGKTQLVNHFINAFPFVGKRFGGTVALDLIGGLDFGYCLSSKDNGEIYGNSSVEVKSVDRKYISFDVRPRIQLNLNYRKFNVYTGYSYGLTNYMQGSIGGTADASSRLVRFGIGYRIL